MASAAEEINRVADLCARIPLPPRGAVVASRLLEPVADFLGAETATLRSFSHPSPAVKPLSIVSVGIPAKVHEAYLSEYHRLDPVGRLLSCALMKPLLAHPGGRWARHDGTSMRLDHYQQEFGRFRREFLLPNGFYHHVGFCIRDSRGPALLFDFHRGAGSCKFGSIERARARLLALYLHARSDLCPALGAQHETISVVALSVREGEVAEAVATGLSNKGIASQLEISVRTVENHLRSVFAKLGVSTRTQLATKLRDARDSIASREE